MKKFLVLFFASLLLSSISFADGVWTTSTSNTKSSTTLFADDFEGGTSNWLLTGAWGTTTTQSYSGSNSLTESPTGNYGNNTTSYATMANGVDLDQGGTILSAELSFWNKYNIEAGFDYMYVDVSVDDFSTYTNIASFDGEVTDWTKQTISLGGFVGNSNVKVRFRFESDGGLDLDGMYIDDFMITGSDEDVASPFIVYSPKPFYQAGLGDENIVANIYDVSGIQTAELKYSVDGGAVQTVSSTNNIDEYTFVIPTQTAGAWVEYWIVATDNSPAHNSVEGTHHNYIAGYYYAYDNGVVDFYFEVGGTNTNGNPNPTAAAVKVTIGDAQLTTLLLRGYTDVDHANDDMTVVVWDDNGGLPGNEIVSIPNVTPEATLSNTSAMTRIDMRPYSAQLSGLNGNYYIGFKMTATTTARSTETSPGSYGRSFFYNGTIWETTDADIHFRAITTEPQADIEGPSIGYIGEIDYLGTLSANNVVATITDMSGIASATLDYSVDGGAVQSVVGSNTTGDNYEFVIPAQTAGSLVEYSITAVDGLTPTPFTTTTSTFKYIAGIHLVNESAQATEYSSVGPASDIPAGAAVKFTMPSEGALVSFLVRNYAVSGQVNSDMQIHVYADNAGLPGDDLITPFSVTPASTIDNNMVYTYVDLRPYLTQLGSLTGDIFVGFTVNSGETAFLLTDPPTLTNSYLFDGTNWFLNDAKGYHFTAVISDEPMVDVALIENKDVVVYPNPTNDIINISANENIKNIFVTNITGQIVISTNVNAKSYKFDLNDLVKGIYMFNITTENNTITKKVIVE